MLLFLRHMPHSFKQLPSLLPQLHRLIAKMASTTGSHVYTLPVSEGTKVSVSHLPRVIALHDLCVRTCKRLLAVHLRRIKRSKAADSKQKRNVIESQGERVNSVHSKYGQTRGDKRKIGEPEIRSSDICHKRARYTVTI